MKSITGLMLVPALVAAAGTSDSQIAGTWSGRLHDQPCIKLTVKDHSGKLSGKITFYFLVLEDGAWKVKGADSVDLIYPRLEGKEFVFGVIHAKKHGSTDPADQEIKTFRIQLTGKSKAVFKNAGADGDLTLRRRGD